MDFMKWLNSLDELLYEVMSWLLFFPLTLWRAGVRPFRTMAEVARQAALPEPEQYGAVLSPPLFLSLGLLLAHAISTALGETDAIIANRHGLASLVDDNASALVLRVVVFAAFPLFLSARMIRAQRLPLDRTTLRRPFYEQCYPAAVFAIGLSLGTSFAILPRPELHASGQALIAATLLNYIVVETRWFERKLGCGVVRALASVMLGLLEGAMFLVFVGFLFTR